MTRVLQSEPWTRPFARALPESNHVHIGQSNHMRGIAMDLPTRAWPMGTYRSLATQRELYENWVERTDRWRAQAGRVSTDDAIALVRGFPRVNARLVAWGGRDGDIQLGSTQDAARERYLGARARMLRGIFRLAHKREADRLVTNALRDMGREFDAIWAV